MKSAKMPFICPTFASKQDEKISMSHWTFIQHDTMLAPCWINSFDKCTGKINAIDGTFGALQMLSIVSQPANQAQSPICRFRCRCTFFAPFSHLFFALFHKFFTLRKVLLFCAALACQRGGETNIEIFLPSDV